MRTDEPAIAQRQEEFRSRTCTFGLDEQLSDGGFEKPQLVLPVNERKVKEIPIIDSTLPGLINQYLPGVAESTRFFPTVKSPTMITRGQRKSESV